MAFDHYENCHPVINKLLNYFANLEDGKVFPYPYTKDPELEPLVEAAKQYLSGLVAKQFKMSSPEVNLKYRASNSKRWDDGAFVEMAFHIEQRFGDVWLDIYFPYSINRKGYCGGTDVNLNWGVYNQEGIKVQLGDKEIPAISWGKNAETELPKLYRWFRSSVPKTYVLLIEKIKSTNRRVSAGPQDYYTPEESEHDAAVAQGWTVIKLKKFMKFYKIALPDT